MLSTSHPFKLPSHHRLDAMEKIEFFSVSPGVPTAPTVSLFSGRTHSIVRVSKTMCGFLTWRFRGRQTPPVFSIRARPLNLQCKFPSIRWRENLRNGLEPKLLVMFLTCGREL